MKEFEGNKWGLKGKEGGRSPLSQQKNASKENEKGV